MLVNGYLADLLDAQFDNLIENESADWETASLIDIANYKNGLAMQRFRPAGDDAGLPVLKIRELGQGYCGNDAERCRSDIDESVTIHDGDLIFSWSGTLLLDFWAGGDAGLNQHLFKVTSSAYPSWFYYMWTKQHMRRFIALAKDRATTMGHIKRSALQESEVLVPPTGRLAELTEHMQPIVEEMVGLKIQSRKLGELRDALLPKLMSGEIDVSEVELSTPPNSHLLFAASICLAILAHWLAFAKLVIVRHAYWRPSFFVMRFSVSLRIGFIFIMEWKSEADMAKGVIYILTNPSFEDYVKIGYADDLSERLRKLNRSETIPFAFRAYATYDVDHRLTDKELHNLIDSLNPDLRSVETFDGKKRTKEFFAMKPEEAYAILEAIAKISGTTARLHRVTPTGDELRDEEIADEMRRESRRGPFRFSMVGIPVGAEVSFANDPAVTAEVVDDRHIRIGNEVTSLSAAAQRLLGCANPVQGPMYWEYGGRRLSDIRNDLGL